MLRLAAEKERAAAERRHAEVTAELAKSKELEEELVDTQVCRSIHFPCALNGVSHVAQEKMFVALGMQKTLRMRLMAANDKVCF